MKKILIVVDMQNDFINGALGTKEAEAIVPDVVKTVNGFNGEVIFTRDTHFENYLQSQEGNKLPVIHCVKCTDGWEICNELKKTNKYNLARIFDKKTFGSDELAEYIGAEKPEEIFIVGLCTDICVISNAMTAKAFSPESEITVYEDCCAGVTPQSHQTALNAMKMCQINIKKSFEE